jgi:hypothetical protein
MAKKQDSQPQQTKEDFLLAQLQEEVILKDGTQLKAVALATLAAATSRAVAVRTRAGGWSRRPSDV